MTFYKKSPEDFEQIRGRVCETVWSPQQCFTEKDCLSLEMSGETFCILQLTDIHLRQYTRGTFSAAKNIRKMIRRQKPDLVVVTGDFTAAEDNRRDTKWLIHLLDSVGVPWTVTLGNHDSQGKYDRNYIGDLLENSRHGLFRKGPASVPGVGNFVITLCHNGCVKGALFFLDSHTSFVLNGLEYEALSKTQIDWYTWAVRGLRTLNKGCAAPVPSLLFQHIPLPEFQAAWENGEVLFGVMGEDKVYAPDENTGMFAAVCALKSTKGIFVGHDHANTFCSRYQGVLLGYGVQTRFTKSAAEGKYAASRILFSETGAVHSAPVPY